MPTFVRLLSFSTSGKFNAKKDSQTINQALQELREKGARIISIVPVMGGGFGSVPAIYTIIYEAPSPIE